MAGGRPPGFVETPQPCRYHIAMRSTPPREPADLSTVIVSRGQISRRVAELAQEIASDCGPQELTVVAILDGALIFLADLVRRLPMPLVLVTVGVRSYRGRAVTAGPLEVHRGIHTDLAGRRVLIVDDIYDTGATLAAVMERVARHGPNSCRTCVLLRKRRDDEPAGPRPDFVGFDIPDVFVVGYGLDYDGRYRNLPDVVALKRSEEGTS